MDIFFFQEFTLKIKKPKVHKIPTTGAVGQYFAMYKWAFSRDVDVDVVMTELTFPGSVKRGSRFELFFHQVAGFVKGLPGCKEHAATFKTEVTFSTAFNISSDLVLMF